MDILIELVFIISYMAVTYHIIALKYEKSGLFSGSSQRSKSLLVILHFFIVISNILLYFRLISNDFRQMPYYFSVPGSLLFIFGIFMICWGIYTLRTAVFIPDNKLIIAGPYKFIRHPMYFGGITGAFALALWAGTIPGAVYSLFLAGVLSRIADIEEKDLIARFGNDYLDYRQKVPKLFPDLIRILVYR